MRLFGNPLENEQTRRSRRKYLDDFEIVEVPGKSGHVRKQALYRCMERVAPDLREVLRLLYFEEMSYEEAASVFGVTRKRIDHLAERARRELRKELEKEGITDAFN